MNRYARHHSLLLLELQVFAFRHISESPFLGNDNLLTAGELVPSAAERLDDDGRVGFLCPDRHDDLANVHTRNSSVWFAPRATHARLETNPKSLWHTAEV